MADPDLSLVLLGKAELPDAKELLASPRFEGLGATVKRLAADQLVFGLGSGGHLLISLIETPPPELGPQALFGSLSETALEEAKAHLIVAGIGLSGSRTERDAYFAQLVAAILECSSSLGASFGEGLCYQDAGFFTRAVDAADGEVPVFLTVDITAAPEPGERISFLTHGMGRYGREELFLTAPLSGEGALPLMFELMHWLVTEPERAIRPGDTLGRTEDERIPVQRSPSPIEGDPDVLRLDLEAD